jgi:predicted acylesterase/phospholipase RssA
MKGGITSGVIYPKAVLALAKEYHFRSIGGTSAGAIAAATTAAAEYGRRQKQADPKHNERLAGFTLMEGEIIDQLTEPGFIKSMFQPQEETEPLLNGLLAYRKRQQRDATRSTRKRSHAGSLRTRIRDALLTICETAAKAAWGPLKRAAFLGLGGGALVAALLGAAALLAGNGVVAALLIVLAIFVVALGWLIGSIVGVLNLLTSEVPLKNGYGICTGKGGKNALTNWLAETIDRLAGLPERETPLTFRQLSLNHQQQGSSAFDPAKSITLNMVTTNLSQGQPYTLPFTSGPFLFSKQEFEKLFPRYVVKYMIAFSKQNWPEDIAEHPITITLPQGEDHWRETEAGEKTETHELYFLPRGLDLPVIVATRMSLSFPLLLSAVPLWTINEACIGKAGHGKTFLAPEDLQRNWFSDGGTCSNFPIQFYDRWFPNQPTFGINLETLPDTFFDKNNKEQPISLKPTIRQYRSIIRPEQPEQPKQPEQEWAVFHDTPSLNGDSLGRLAHLPRPFPDGRPLPRWEPLGGELGSFIWSIINTGLFYRDTVQARLPSYYDRIVTVYQSENEGGLNLDMKKSVVDGIADRGEQAGEELVEQFDFRQHRWVRLRLLLAEIEEQLFRLRDSLLAEDLYTCDTHVDAASQPQSAVIAPVVPAPRLDWNDERLQGCITTLGAIIEEAGLNANIIHNTIEYQSRLSEEKVPYWVGEEWSKTHSKVAVERFLMLQLMIEMWAQRDGKDQEGTVFRDGNAPARNNMSMRVAPDL